MPAGTETSFPSIVRVTSARLGMVVEKSRALEGPATCLEMCLEASLGSMAVGAEEEGRKEVVHKRFMTFCDR